MTSIEDAAVSGCSGLTSIEIPNSVTSIGGYAFSGCSALTKIYLYNTTPPVFYSSGYDVFHVFSETVIYNATLYVPVGAKSKYKEAKGWKEFTNIEEIQL